MLIRKRNNLAAIIDPASSFIINRDVYTNNLESPLFFIDFYVSGDRGIVVIVISRRATNEY